MSLVELRGVAKQFGATPVLREVDLAVAAGSITAVLGPSGSGKTTLLRLIAGFEQVDGGTIAIGGDVVDDGRRTLRSRHRGVGYVPQDDALFPHLTVSGNVGFGLSRAQRPAVVPTLLELVGLGSLARRYPHQLSGGQQQRVALARALAIKPTVVLLDEPFGSLDASLRVDLRRDVARILRETQATTILVTHDQDEALALADQVAVLDHGRVVACADPRVLYHEPPSLDAARSIGDVNVIAGHARGDQATCALGSIALQRHGDELREGPCLLLLRPEQLTLRADRAERTSGAVVLAHQFHGHDAMVTLELDEAPREVLLARVPGDLAAATGTHVWVEVSGAATAWPLEPPAERA